MGKRSNFERIPQDAYQTIDPKAVRRLYRHLQGVRTFSEPCAGEGKLIRMLEERGLKCVHSNDVKENVDALTLRDFGGADAIVTNPPWSREILHPMIRHFQHFAPTWLLFDAGWAFTEQSAPYINQCSHIIVVGRLKWIEDTDMTGKDDCCWYCFDRHHTGGPKFIGVPEKEPA